MNRFLKSTGFVATMLLAGPAFATDLTQMSAAEREIFRAEVRAYLMANPEVIIEAVAELERKQAAAQENKDVALIQSNAEAIFDDGYSHVGGNPEGDITLVEFVDYRCGYCRKAHDEVQELVATDGNIRFITKEFPILGPESVASARFAIAVRTLAGDAAYVTANNALIKFKGAVNDAALRRLAETLGLDADAVAREMENAAIDQQIADIRALAQKLQINGTPTFVVGDTLLRGYLPLDAMREVVSAARQES